MLNLPPQLNLPRNSTLIKPAGTDTFRLSSSKILRIYGTNLQNPSDEIRRIYVPSEGYIFNQRDQSGADAKIVAYLCRAGNFRQLFLEGIKPHVYVALHVFAGYWARELQVSMEWFDTTYLRADIQKLKLTPNWKQLETRIKKHDELNPSETPYYFVGKKICHSSNYDMGATTFALDVLTESEGRVIITRKEAERFLYIYHSLFPEIRQWQRETRDQLIATRTLYTLQGYPRYFNQKDLDDDSLFKAGYAFVPQGTVAIINNTAQTDFQLKIEDYSWDCNLLNNMHDSLLVESPIKDDLWREYDKELARSLEQELTSPRGEKFKMGTEGKVGYNWGNYHAEDNPQGLQEIKS